MFLGVPPRILRFESLADVEERIGDVRFAPKTDRRAALLTIFRRVSSLRSSEYGMALPQAKAEPHEACPVDAIVLGPNYEFATETPESFTIQQRTSACER